MFEDPIHSSFFWVGIAIIIAQLSLITYIIIRLATKSRKRFDEVIKDVKKWDKFPIVLEWSRGANMSAFFFECCGFQLICDDNGLAEKLILHTEGSESIELTSIVDDGLFTPAALAVAYKELVDATHEGKQRHCLNDALNGTMETCGHYRSSYKHMQKFTYAEHHYAIAGPQVLVAITGVRTARLGSLAMNLRVAGIVEALNSVDHVSVLGSALGKLIEKGGNIKEDGPVPFCRGMNDLYINCLPHVRLTVDQLGSAAMVYVMGVMGKLCVEDAYDFVEQVLTCTLSQNNLLDKPYNPDQHWSP